jgi:DNA-binding response OmpR family regulator
VQLILMDVMMPRVDGLSAIMNIRKTKNIPIIILSAKTEDSDKILGLNVGADDYISKPYNPMELLARIRSQLRRYLKLGASADTESEAYLTVGGLQMDLASKILYVDGRPVKLTATEWKILELLIRNPGHVFSAEEIYTRVWKESAFAVENTVMVHIRRIREKIEIDPKDPRYLKVVWGIGYKIEK